MRHVTIRTKRTGLDKLLLVGQQQLLTTVDAAPAGSCSKVRFPSLLLILPFLPVSVASSPCFLLGVAYEASVTEFASDG